MKIAVTADGMDANSTVSEKFKDARWLLIVDMDQCCICEIIEKNSDDSENKNFAEIIAERNCESVICGDLEAIPFELLAANQITRSRGGGLIVSDALNCESMLPLITDFIGGSGCSSSHI